MVMKALVQYLRDAAAGEISSCPAAIDVLWHRWLQFPTAYSQLCLRHFGVVIEHVPDGVDKCRAEVAVPAITPLR